MVSYIMAAVMEKLSPVVRQIQKEMSRRNMKTFQLAERADVSIANLYDVFRGTVSPRLASLEKIARVLDLKITATFR